MFMVSNIDIVKTDCWKKLGADNVNVFHTSLDSHVFLFEVLYFQGTLWLGIGVGALAS